MSEKSGPTLQRRAVFAGAGAVGALAGAAAVLPLARQAETVTKDPAAKAETGGGYQVTQHVLRYYQTARV